MLGLGLCSCLVPIAQRLFDSKDDYSNFLERHLEFFNAHPYMASFALGALARLEEDAIVKNWADTRPIEIFKERLCGPLGAIGDNLFWKMIRPMSLLIGMCISFFAGWAGLISAFLIYNAFHFFIRVWGVYQGYRKGFDIIRDLSISGTQKIIDLFQKISSTILGFTIVTGMVWSSRQLPEAAGNIPFLVLLIISLLIAWPKKVSTEMSILIIILISITFGLMIQ